MHQFLTNYRVNWGVGASRRCSNCISCHHIELNIRPKDEFECCHHWFIKYLFLVKRWWIPGQKSVDPVSEQVSPCVANCPTLSVFCLLLHREPEQRKDLELRTRTRKWTWNKNDWELDAKRELGAKTGNESSRERTQVYKNKKIESAPCDWTSLYALRRSPCQCDRGSKKVF